MNLQKNFTQMTRTAAPIEDLVPDYSILDQVGYSYPVHDAYFGYTSRGCIRKCHFCGVPKLEGAQRDTESLTQLVTDIEKLYGPKKDLILMDNNVVASPRFKEIIAEIRDLGFVPGAKLSRGGTPVQRRVDFNQGVDARILCRDPVYLTGTSYHLYQAIADRVRSPGRQESPTNRPCAYAAGHGLTELSNYMLYNFRDSPSDLFTRMRPQRRPKRGARYPHLVLPDALPAHGSPGPRSHRCEVVALPAPVDAAHSPSDPWRR